MTDDPLAPYRIDQPLTAEEQELLDVLGNSDRGEGYLETLKEAGLDVAINGVTAPRLTFSHKDREVVELALAQTLSPLSLELLQRGRPRLAQGAAGLGLRLGLEVFGPKHQDTLYIRHTLARCFEALGRVGEALILNQDTLADREQVLGPDHLDTLASRNNVGTSLLALGQTEKALPMFATNLDACKRLLGREHPDTLTSRDNLASCLEGLGRADEGLLLHEATLKAKESVLGPDHPDTLVSRHNLAVCLQMLGRSGEALPLCEATLEARASVLGTGHPDTLMSRKNLARCLEALGHEGEALPHYEAALEGCGAALGEAHPETLKSANGMASCLRALGRAGEALPHYEAALEGFRAVVGEAHPDTLMSRNNLASCLNALGRAGEALPHCEAALEGCRTVLGEAHPDTLTGRNNLACCFEALGRASAALPHHEATLAQRRTVLGEAHPDTLQSRNNLARCVQALGRASEALPHFEAALEKRRTVLGEAHPDTLTSLNNLATCLEALGRAGEALPHYEAALEGCRAVLGETHPQTLGSCNNLAHCLEALGRASDALPHFEAALEKRRTVLGEAHPATLTSRNNLAHCLEALGRAGEALPHYEAALEGFRAVVGEAHPDTLMSLNNLAFCLEDLGRLGEALAQWRALVTALQGQPQPGGTWLEVLGNCAAALAKYARASRLTDWDSLFADQSTSLLAVIDLESPEQLEAAREGVAKFYTTYLGLCIDQDRRDLIPQVLAARQGRKLAALVLDELEAAGEALDPASPRGRFQALRLELRQLALGLRVVEGGGGAPSVEGDRQLDAESAIARQRNQMAAYKAKLDAYRALRTELEATDPGFALTAAALRPNLEDLQARLGDGEGLVLLFEQADAPGETASRLALLLTAVASVLVPLTDPLLNQGLALARTWSAQLFTRSGMRKVAAAEEAVPAPCNLFEDDSPVGALATALREGLWAPLAENLAGLDRLHLVTHGSWHLLPVELGAPVGLALSSYPGFIYYHRLRHQGELPGSSTPPTGESNRSTAPSANSAIGLAVHAAEDRPGLEPIPFVQAEAKLIEALWPGPVHPDPDLDAEHPRLATLQLAAHGQADAKDPARANVVLRDQTLDFQAVLKACQHPPVVVLSACTVGRTSDDPDGEPLGLVGSFLLKGSRFVIASLQPVPDFYTPLLITLFYQSWLQTGSPDTALTEAKRRLQTGDWYAETEGLIRRHYPPIIELGLEAASRSAKVSGWRDPLLRFTHAWPFPDPYRYLDPDEHQHRLDDLREQIAESQGRPRLVAAILDALVAERGRLPAGVIDTLCTWVRGFGSLR